MLKRRPIIAEEEALEQAAYVQAKDDKERVHMIFTAILVCLTFIALTVWISLCLA